MSRKMALVPAHQVPMLMAASPAGTIPQLLPPSVQQMLQPITRTVIQEINDKMMAILNDPSMNNEDKMKKYNDAFQHYKQMYLQHIEPKPVLVRQVQQQQQQPQQQQQQAQAQPIALQSVKPEDDDVSLHPTAIKTENLLKDFRRGKVGSAEYLLQAIYNSDGVLGWNDKQELVVNGMVIPGSSITKLIHVLVHKGRPPKSFAGLAAILQGLSSMKQDVTAKIENEVIKNRIKKMRHQKGSGDAVGNQAMVVRPHMKTPSPDKVAAITSALLRNKKQKTKKKNTKKRTLTVTIKKKKDCNIRLKKWIKF